ncbi:MAG: ABC transporter ATP-binding protein [Armatimonadota bacterium]|nr:ABC transporter ATP-binding protein [Armatimonadota bacterium]MDR7423277.1 ABC transporter ATP-binding protein [Armatimonadota bacterium]MDR7453834.1 ABC transporter ATP-binding protein [Armatimonadota bacterium]MDR7456435.1 ABC transporter ATP-binding protein [Armatimonadota bacterium]MDR7495925.1 ABC transporter ATP-binding protein [Armatimonadota bacterium]
MAELVLEGLSKAYGAVWAVRDVSLAVADGEFVTLLGPSGCGKTTTLRMVAGFIRPTAGRIVLDGRLLSAVEGHVMVPPERRGMGMVFQSYAVWPHMTVFDNVAYPLRVAGLSRHEVAGRTTRALELVHLEGLAGQYPHQLSGGQQQRVALARALVNEPAVLLLDEPLSNLDAKLREEMRFEIQDLQRRLRITVLYVTHDQGEAMVLSDRIAVMVSGRIVQVGAPEELYERPADPFVASFLGVANFLRGEVVGADGGAARVRLDGLPEADSLRVPGAAPAGRVLVCVRPEALACDPDGPLRGQVVRRTYLGSGLDYLVAVGPHTVRLAGGPDLDLRVGEEVRLAVRRAVLYPETSATTSSGRSAT